MFSLENSHLPVSRFKAEDQLGQPELKPWLKKIIPPFRKFLVKTRASSPYTMVPLYDGAHPHQTQVQKEDDTGGANRRFHARLS